MVDNEIQEAAYMYKKVDGESYCAKLRFQEIALKKHYTLNDDKLTDFHDYWSFLAGITKSVSKNNKSMAKKTVAIRAHCDRATKQCLEAYKKAPKEVQSKAVDAARDDSSITSDELLAICNGEADYDDMARDTNKKAKEKSKVFDIADDDGSSVSAVEEYEEWLEANPEQKPDKEKLLHMYSTLVLGASFHYANLQKYHPDFLTDDKLIGALEKKLRNDREISDCSPEVYTKWACRMKNMVGDLSANIDKVKDKLDGVTIN